VYKRQVLLSIYSFLIPYLLIFGAFFLILIAVRIIKTDLKLDRLETAEGKIEKTDKNGGLRTGLLINLTNPSFFFGVIASSFLVHSFATSIGLNTGGLDLLVQENVVSIQEVTGEGLIDLDTTYIKHKPIDEKAQHSSYTLFLSVTYASALGLGGFTWLFILTKLLVKYRNKINVEILNLIIRSLGFILCLIALYLIWESYSILFH
jgi:threonine/homoserine/homoserine lactone efflux protein